MNPDVLDTAYYKCDAGEYDNVLRCTERIYEQQDSCNNKKSCHQENKPAVNGSELKHEDLAAELYDTVDKEKYSEDSGHQLQYKIRLYDTDYTDGHYYQRINENDLCTCRLAVILFPELLYRYQISDDLA